MKRVIICDIDGTIAEIGDRFKIIEKENLTKQDYDEFNASSVNSN